MPTSFITASQKDWIRSVHRNGGLPSRMFGRQTERIPQEQALKVITQYPDYVAVVARKYPERITDLMGYQSLIIDASLEKKGDCWAGYDWRFHQKDVSRPSLVWLTNDSTLCLLAFTGWAKVPWYSYCFSLSHRSADCELALDQPRPPAKPPGYSVFVENELTCTFPGCKYNHVCYICVQGQGNSDVAHRALDCPQHSTLSHQLIPPLFPKHTGPKL